MGLVIYNLKEIIPLTASTLQFWHPQIVTSEYFSSAVALTKREEIYFSHPLHKRLELQCSTFHVCCTCWPIVSEIKPDWLWGFQWRGTGNKIQRLTAGHRQVEFEGSSLGQWGRITLGKWWTESAKQLSDKHTGTQVVQQVNSKAGLQLLRN